MVQQSHEPGYSVSPVARSAAVKRRLRGSDWTDGRQRRHSDDLGLVEQLRSAIENLPSYGYHRAWALLRRERACQRSTSSGYTGSCAHTACCCNAELLRYGRSAAMMGMVSVDASNQRWCSDGFWPYASRLEHVQLQWFADGSLNNI